MKTHILLPTVILFCSFSSAFSATLVGLWNFDGTVGQSVGMVTNSVGALNMTATKSGSNVFPIYGSAIPGSAVYDPLTDQTYNLISSLEVSQWNQGATTGATTDLDSSSGFTLQLWFNLPTNANPNNVVVKRFGTTGWRILADGTGRLYAQFNDGTTTTNLWSDGSIGSVFDGEWHNLVLTFNGATGSATFAIDGVKNSLTYAGSKTAITSSGLELIVGANVGHGNFSALSYADGVLTDGQLMSVIPEATSVAYLIFGMFVLARRGARTPQRRPRPEGV